ncbi:hypothetical protein CPB83DRAFT_858148 [Crepidotus variabilis]|uniref:Uncharacterized protein n=1 Tax=Crepidotus variabilis TaxID=179855 RepID=A0A9P6JMH1_9AGAR|nr:hypothetical protein CPB83DRAFT_858148 [Crepidotus variabilis]
MSKNNSSSNPRNIRLVEGDMSENSGSSNSRSWKDKRAAIRAARAARKPEGVIEGSTGVAEVDNPRISPPSETFPLPFEGSAQGTIHSDVEITQPSSVGIVEIFQSSAEAQEPDGTNADVQNPIPEIPPSPLQLSIDLYSLPNIEGLSEHEPVGDQGRSSSSSSATYGRAPLPKKHLVALYPLSDISEPVGDVDENPDFTMSSNLPLVEGAVQTHSSQDPDRNGLAARTVGGILEVPPSPPQLSIQLYPLPSTVEYSDNRHR